MFKPPWQIYNEEMSNLCNGDALWEPAPHTQLKRVRLGDVGFIREGRFNKLFSATCPPSPLEKLDIGPNIPLKFQAPGYLTADQEINEVRYINSASIAPVSPPPAMEPAFNLSFELPGPRGAALVTKYPTFRENVHDLGKLEKYTKSHYASWKEFALEAGYGEVKPVLVTGVDRTKDFATMCYSNYANGLECEFKTSAPGAPAWGEWNASKFIYTNYGPQLVLPLSTASVTGFWSPHERNSTLPNNSGSKTDLEDYNQSVFVRYYTMRERKSRVPEVIKDLASTHSLGATDGNGESPLGHLDSDSSSDTTPSLFDGGWNDDRGSTTSVDTESDIAACNPYVEERNTLDAIADYIFENSNAQSALLHHQDLALLRKTSSNSHARMLEQLPIMVDEDGVGTVGQYQPGAALSSLPNGREHKGATVGAGGPVSAQSPYNLGRKRATTQDEMREPKRTKQGMSLDSDPQHEAVGTTCSPLPMSLMYSNLQIVQQVPYRVTTGQRNWVPLPPIEFLVDGSCGIRLTDALDVNFTGLHGRDDPMFVGSECGSSISCRLQFPGYPLGTATKITTTTRKGVRITREKLAHEVAKHIKHYLGDTKIAGTSYPIPFWDMILTKLIHVSRASWQPEMCYPPPPTGRSRPPDLHAHTFSITDTLTTKRWEA